MLYKYKRKMGKVYVIEIGRKEEQSTISGTEILFNTPTLWMQISLQEYT